MLDGLVSTHCVLSNTMLRVNMLSIVVVSANMLIVLMLSIVVLRVKMLNVMLGVIMLSVVLPSAMVPKYCFNCNPINYVISNPYFLTSIVMGQVLQLDGLDKFGKIQC
jgi:hypothetical protein